MPFRNIFWGLLMTVVDFRVDDLDLIPDFIGYFIAFWGLRLLAPLHGSFGFASGASLLLAVLSLPNLVAAEYQALAFAVIAADLLLLWWICSGISALATARGAARLAEAALSRRTWLVVLAGVHAVLLAAPDLARQLVIPIVVFAFAVGFLVLHLVWKASVELTPLAQEMPTEG